MGSNRCGLLRVVLVPFQLILNETEIKDATDGTALVIKAVRMLSEIEPTSTGPVTSSKVTR